MNKEDLSKILNERFNISIDWTKMNRDDLILFERKTRNVITDLSVDRIYEVCDDPVDLALSILLREGGSNLGKRIMDVIYMIRNMRKRGALL